MRQLINGNRKFALQHIERDDIAAITREAAECLEYFSISIFGRTEVDVVNVGLARLIVFL